MLSTQLLVIVLAAFAAHCSAIPDVDAADGQMDADVSGGLRNTRSVIKSAASLTKRDLQAPLFSSVVVSGTNSNSTVGGNATAGGNGTTGSGDSSGDDDDCEDEDEDEDGGDGDSDGGDDEDCEDEEDDGDDGDGDGDDDDDDDDDDCEENEDGGEDSESSESVSSPSASTQVGSTSAPLVFAGSSPSSTYWQGSGSITSSSPESLSTSPGSAGSSGSGSFSSGSGDSSYGSGSSTASTPTASGSSSNTNSSSGSGQVYTGGNATFFYQGGAAGACGTVHADSDLICAMDEALYGTAGNASPLCGKQVNITNTQNGKSVVVTVADMCPGCKNANSIDLSTGAFDQIADESTGTVPIEWYYIS